MNDQAEDESELARVDLTPEYVLSRVKDWQRRVETLTTDLEAWSVEQGFTVKRGVPVNTREPLMKQYEVAAVSLPTLEITAPTHRVYRVVPKGLWTIGANGRVDLTTGRGIYQIVDLAAPFEKPDWRIAGPTLREGQKLTAASYASVVQGV